MKAEKQEKEKGGEGAQLQIEHSLFGPKWMERMYESRVDCPPCFSTTLELYCIPMTCLEV